MIEVMEKTLCIIHDVTSEKKIKAIIMSDEEYYESYISKFVGADKQIKVNLLRKSKHVLMRLFSGYTLRRFEPFRKEIGRAIEAVMVSMLYRCNVRPVY